MEKEQIQGWNPLCCCCPQTTQGAVMCGSVLVVIGSVWLLNNLGIFSLLLNLIWPLALIGIGLYFLKQTVNYTE